MELINANELLVDQSTIYLINKETDIDRLKFSKSEFAYLKKSIKEDKKIISFNHFYKWSYFVVIENKDKAFQTKEQIRKSGAKLVSQINEQKISEVAVINLSEFKEAACFFAEGIALANYQFLKYYNDAEKKKNTLQKIIIVNEPSSKIEELQHKLKAVYATRDLVNEPVSYLNAVQLAQEIKELSIEAGFSVEIFNKKKIESLRMGGLLAVNKGSIDPPTFSILEWKPENAVNKKPLVLVGKGVVFDTGGLSLKPTKNSMDIMKCDMAGAAAVIGAMYTVAKNKVPFYVVALIPATDNRPDGNAYAPGDVIKMYNGTFVEVLNTDAEGRMILADALSYAKHYKPFLSVDVATLTGAAHAAIGYYATVTMGNADKKYFEMLTQSSEETYERVVEFPFWEEYAELLKSDVADVKNIGGATAGAITAGKFLEKFAISPYIHLDIAGPAYMDSNDGYLLKGGSGVGVRLLYEFIVNLSSNYKE
jgi:leucyl aminopeptidase